MMPQEYSKVMHDNGGEDGVAYHRAEHCTVLSVSIDHY